MSWNIAIDGPAGAGKSTIAKRAAKALGFVYVDTGAMYRGIALGLMRMGKDAEEGEALSAALDKIEVGLSYDNGVQQVLLNGENVSDLIRTEEVSAAASRTSAKPEVRAKLLDLQKNMAARYNVIMDGRDIGTVILPDAQLKVFLTASVEVRAQRRYLEQQKKGVECTLEEIREDIEKRDYQDTHREISALWQAEDAVLLDTSDLDIDGVVAEILRLAEEKQIPAASGK